MALDFIDVSHLAATLVMRYSAHFNDDRRRQTYANSPHHDTQTILLRGPTGGNDIAPADLKSWWQSDVVHRDEAILEDWPAAVRVLGQIEESHRRRAGMAPVFGKIMVVALKPGGVVDWHTDQGPYAEAHDRFHICVIPSGGAIMHSGCMSAALPVGQLTWFNNRIPHSAVNFGTVARVHLIVDIRKPPPEKVN